MVGISHYHGKGILHCCYLVNIVNLSVCKILSGTEDSIEPDGMCVLIYNLELFADIFLGFKPFPQTSAVNLDARDQQGWCAIHHLVCPLEYGTYDNVRLLALLAGAGANITAADSAGLTPLDYAFIRGAPALVKAIQKLMGRPKADWVSGDILSTTFVTGFACFEIMLCCMVEQVTLHDLRKGFLLDSCYSKADWMIGIPSHL